MSEISAVSIRYSRLQNATGLITYEATTVVPNGSSFEVLEQARVEARKAVLPWLEDRRFGILVDWGEAKVCQAWGYPGALVVVVLFNVQDPPG